MLDYRPCGACAALVPADTGCTHWKPGAKSGKRMGWVQGRARGTARPIPADSPEVDLAFLRVLDSGVTPRVE